MSSHYITTTLRSAYNDMLDTLSAEGVTYGYNTEAANVISTQIDISISVIDNVLDEYVIIPIGTAQIWAARYLDRSILSHEVNSIDSKRYRSYIKEYLLRVRAAINSDLDIEYLRTLPIPILVDDNQFYQIKYIIDKATRCQGCNSIVIDNEYHKYDPSHIREMENATIARSGFIDIYSFRDSINVALPDHVLGIILDRLPSNHIKATSLAIWISNEVANLLRTYYTIFAEDMTIIEYLDKADVKASLSK